MFFGRMQMHRQSSSVVIRQSLCDAMSPVFRIKQSTLCMFASRERDHNLSCAVLGPALVIDATAAASGYG